MKRIECFIGIVACAFLLATSTVVLSQSGEEVKNESETAIEAQQPEEKSETPAQEPASAELTGDAKEVVEMVDLAIDKFEEKGRDYTLKVLNASMGPFRRGSLYVFAADFNGVNLAHPAKRDLVGKNAWKLKGAKGKFLVQEMIKVAKDQGEGWVEYWWNRTGEKEPVLKRAYVKRVPGEDIWLGSAYIVKGK